MLNKNLQFSSDNSLNIFYVRHDDGIIWSFKNYPIKHKDEMVIVNHVICFNFGFGTDNSQLVSNQNLQQNDMANGRGAQCGLNSSVNFVSVYAAALILLIVCYWMKDLIGFYIDFLIFESKWTSKDITVAEFYSSAKAIVKDFFLNI